MLHSFGRDFSPFHEVDEFFHTELVKRSPEPIDFYDASIFTARYREPDEEGSLLKYLNDLFAGRKLDMVVTLGAPAAYFVQKHRQLLFPVQPVVFAAIDERRLDGTPVTSNDTVVGVTIDLASFAKNILQLRPETTEVAVVIGNSPNEQYWVAEMQRAFQPFYGQAKFVWLNNSPVDEMTRHIAGLSAKSAILYFMIAVDASGATYPLDAGFPRIRAAAKVPIFSFGDYNIGQGAVGGPKIRTEALGHRMADVALRILSGEKPGNIKTAALASGTPQYDWRELNRWQISESLLPTDGEVLYRTPTIWEQYRWQMTGLLSAMILQALIMSWLLFERYRRISAEHLSRSRMLEVIHLNRTATAGALSASIAHELNQPLGAILSNAEAAEIILSTNDPDLVEVREILSDIKQADERAAGIIVHMRKLLKKQGESDLQQFDLSDAIARAVQILSPELKRQGIALSIAGVSHPLPVRVDQVHLEQVLLNLASNGIDAMRTAGQDSRKLSIQTAMNAAGRVEVSVADSGSGIPPAKLKDIFETFYTTKEEGTGLGLSIARTIVETYGGVIWAENVSSGGAVFRFTLPLSDARKV